MYNDVKYILNYLGIEYYDHADDSIYVNKFGVIIKSVDGDWSPVIYPYVSLLLEILDCYE